MNATATEMWKVIPRFPKYEASNLGRIRNVRSKRIMTYHVGHNVSGRKFLFQVLSGRTVSISSIIMRTWNGAPPPKHHIMFLDGDSTNIKLDNMKYATAQEIIKARNKRKKTKRGMQMSERCKNDDNIRRLVADNYSQVGIAKMLNMHHSSISKAIKRMGLVSEHNKKNMERIIKARKEWGE